MSRNLPTAGTHPSPYIYHSPADPSPLKRLKAQVELAHIFIGYAETLHGAGSVIAKWSTEVEAQVLRARNAQELAEAHAQTQAVVARYALWKQRHDQCEDSLRRLWIDFDLTLPKAMAQVAAGGPSEARELLNIQLEYKRRHVEAGNEDFIDVREEGPRARQMVVVQRDIARRRPSFFQWVLPVLF
ncbi:unnamed protein product [Peniophora sp. CBMAI 1063]|nr:unnamed protein product [Peniophora sp. CBMAI 1063]